MKYLIMLVLILGCARKEVAQVYEVPVPESQVTPVSTEVVYAYQGHCAEALATKGKKVVTDKKNTLNYNNIVYCFRSKKAKKRFEQQLEANIEKANGHWKEIERLDNFNKNL